MKIGVFDSGIGGVTVLSELKKRFPGEEYLYFGDTANVPYGTKSETQIRSLVSSAAERIKSKGIDALVIACNTASSIAFKEFKTILDPMPLIDVVDAGVTSVLESVRPSPTIPILILGTRATIKSKIYSRLLRDQNQNLVIHEQECPLLVPMIEEGWVEHPILKSTIEEYIAPYLKLKPGVALLACTHYPWIKTQFETLMPGWKILDSATAVADILEAKLHADLHSSRETTEIDWHFSDVEGVSKKMLPTDSLRLHHF
jgi:glutamate racemase